MLQREQLDERLAWAERQVRAAGEIMLEVARSGQLGIGTKLDKTVVTEADRRINDMLIAQAAVDFPQDGVLGEEASAHADRSLLWVFDPIDDTNGYIYGLTTSMSALALTEDGEPVAAAMYEPVRDMLFTAVKGGGAFQNGEQIHVSDHSALAGAEIAYSPSFSQVVKYRGLYDAIVAAGAKLVPVNGEAFRGGMTANGKITGHLFPGRSAHDIAAVKLIVEEAGGRVTDLTGAEQPYNKGIFGAVVTNGLIHNELLDLVGRFGVDNFIGY
jgi:fructose-1,6-bisphosphatase/inositol monophosphatase family enzyme